MELEFRGMGKWEPIESEWIMDNELYDWIKYYNICKNHWLSLDKYDYIGFGQ